MSAGLLAAAPHLRVEARDAKMRCRSQQSRAQRAAAARKVEDAGIGREDGAIVVGIVTRGRSVKRQDGREKPLCHDVQESPSEETRKDAVRILQTWAEARSRFGKDGPYLFGTFSAADIMFAPVVTRFVTYGFTLPGFAESYAETIMAHPWMEEWYAAAAEEPWTIQRIEDAVT